MQVEPPFDLIPRLFDKFGKLTVGFSGSSTWSGFFETGVVGSSAEVFSSSDFWCISLRMTSSFIGSLSGVGSGSFSTSPFKNR